MGLFNAAERYELLGFNDVKIRIYGVLIIAILFPVVVVGINPLDDSGTYFQCGFVGIFYTSLFWTIDREIVLWMKRVYAGKEKYKKRIIVQSILLFFITISMALCTQGLLVVSNVDDYLVLGLIKVIFASLIITTIIVTIYETIYWFEMYKEGLMRNEELQKENLQSQLEVLKSQVNPHFLFNSLNTLISVIPEDSELAVKFANDLSKVYRYILEIKDKEFVSLDKELTCIDSYEFLLKIRFGDAVHFERGDLGDTKTSYIVPLAIQMLIENAVKHNVLSDSRNLVIKMRMEGEELVVSNNYQPKKINEPSTKLGLENIKRRYELLSQSKISVKQTDELFEVRIPIIKITQAR
ncbi:MAG: histidine kinase [Flavobacteriales bacterium]|nr:histidine kinase [Flavobacteriales bacterium]